MPGQLGRRLAVALVAAAVGLPLLVLPRPAAAASRGPVPGLTGFYAVVAGPARVFVSDPVGGAVAALRPNGTLARMLEDLPGASGMTIVDTTLYVAVSGGARIERFDVSGLRPRSLGAIDTAAFSDPRDLVYAGGRLWFTSGPCGTSGGKLVSVALDGTGLAEVVPAAPVAWTSCPRLNASPFTPNTLFVQGAGASPVTLFEYDVSGATPSLLVSKDLGWGGAGSDVGVLPGGTDLVTATGASSEAPGLAQFATSGLGGPSTTYVAEGAAGVAVDVTDASGGLIAGGVATPDVEQVWVWRVGGADALAQFDLGDGVPLWERGLAFSPDGTRLFAATQPAPGRVEVRSLDPRAASALTLEPSAPSVVFGASADLVVTLAGGDTNRTVRIYGTRAGGTRKLVVEAEVDADGRLSATVEPQATTTYVAVYDGDASTASARSEQVVVEVRPRVEGRMVDADGRAGRYAIYDYSTRCPADPSTCPLFEISVDPNLTGSDFRYVLESRVDGSWRTALEGEAQLGPGSTVTVYFYFPDRSAIGTRYRARAELDAAEDHAAGNSRWSFFKLRPAA